MVKVKELKSKVKDFSLVNSGWNCKLCFKTEEECGESCKDKSWKDVSNANDALREDNQGCLKGSITAIPPWGCVPTVAMSTKLDPAPAGKKLEYCMAEFRAESARRYGEALLKHSKKLAECNTEDVITNSSLGSPADIFWRSAGQMFRSLNETVPQDWTEQEELARKSTDALNTAWSLAKAFSVRIGNSSLTKQITKRLQGAEQLIQNASNHIGHAASKINVIKEAKEKAKSAARAADQASLWTCEDNPKEKAIIRVSMGGGCAGAVRCTFQANNLSPDCQKQFNADSAKKCGAAHVQWANNMDKCNDLKHTPGDFTLIEVGAA